ncbi:hypothetical protein D9M72_199680 [compost metagenome]
MAPIAKALACIEPRNGPRMLRDPSCVMSEKKLSSPMSSTKRTALPRCVAAGGRVFDEGNIGLSRSAAGLGADVDQVMGFVEAR